MSDSSNLSMDGNKNGNGHFYDEFDSLVTKFAESSSYKKVAIFTHAVPDPDAIGSMMGMEWILKKKYDLDVSLFFEGEISHPQNGAVVNLLHPDLYPISEYSRDNFGFNILVDSVPGHAGVGEFDNLKNLFDVVVDHHSDVPQNYPGLIIHKKSGSCSAIIYDMMKHLFGNITDYLDKNSDFDSCMATAIIAGIMTDTHYMSSDDCTKLEIMAFNDLFDYRNPSYLRQIIFFKRKKFWIEKKAQAVSDATIGEDGVAIVGLGLLPAQERDLIPDMADEMVSWASVETAIAFGVVGGDRIEGSVRSLNASLSVSNLCKKLAGKHGTGGGKQGRGAYCLPLAGFSIDDEEDEEDAQEAWNSIRTRETKRITRIFKK